MTDQPKDLPPAAQRALSEAEERRKKADAQALPPELGGRDGPRPLEISLRRSPVLLLRHD